MGLTDSPLCRGCRKEEETPAHVTIHCEGVEKQRTDIIEKLGSLQEACSDIRALLAFWKELGWLERAHSFATYNGPTMWLSEEISGSLLSQSNGQVDQYYAKDYMFGFDREPAKNAPHAPERLLQLMKIHVADTRLRVKDLNNIRFKNDHTYEYQTGYVMAEIIERYRLMMEHHQRPKRYPSDPVFECLKRTEMIQTLYIEIWHLCMMLHEIRRKTVVAAGNAFNSDNEDDLIKGKGKSNDQKLKDLQEARKLAKKLEKKRRLEARMINHMYKKYFNKGGLVTGWGEKATKKAFELNYGWDLAYLPGRGPRLIFSTVHPMGSGPSRSFMEKLMNVLKFIKNMLLQPSLMWEQAKNLYTAIKYIRYMRRLGLMNDQLMYKILSNAIIMNRR